MVHSSQLPSVTALSTLTFSGTQVMFLFHADFFFLFFKDLILFSFRERGRGEKERGRDIHPLPLVCPATQACALTGNRAHDFLTDLSLCGTLQSHAGQGSGRFFSSSKAVFGLKLKTVCQQFQAAGAGGSRSHFAPRTLALVPLCL